MTRNHHLVKRDKAYASASRPSYLNQDGNLVLDEMPLAVDLIGLRPLSLEEQVSRFLSTRTDDHDLVPDSNFLDEEDFHDYLDGLPEDGITEFEVAAEGNPVSRSMSFFEHGVKNILRRQMDGVEYPPKNVADGDRDVPATPPKESSPVSPQEAKTGKDGPQTA